MTALWENRKVIVCVGTGGVGKTTAAASIAVAAAASGLNTLVMTIDPARRLANALGIHYFGNVEREVTAAQLRPFGLELDASLWVMMLDVKRTFDELIQKLSTDPERRQTILRNKIYQQFSTALAGALEYAAVEKLYEVYASDRYDLVVLDTPPSQNALEFLEAPWKMLDFLDDGAVQWLLKPSAVAGKLSMKLLNLGSAVIKRTLGKMAGAETIRELAEFLLALSDLYDGFRERYKAVRTLLASNDLGFVLVTSPDANQRAAMRRFQKDLLNEGFKTRAVIMNRVRSTAYEPEQIEEILSNIKAELSTKDYDLIQGALADEAVLAGQDRRAVVALQKEIGDIPIITLPELPLDVHDLESLVKLHGAFFDVG